MLFFRPRDDRRVIDIPVSAIMGNPYQPRRDVDERHLQQLTRSVAAHGVIVPIIVRPRSERGTYELVAGQRRLLSCRRLGWKTVPAVIRHYDDQQVMEVSLLENLQRHNLSAVEEAEALGRLSREFVRMTRDDLARRMGVDAEELRFREELLGLSMVAREAVITGLITTEHALAILPLATEEEQIQALTRIHREDLSVTETRRMVEGMLAAKAPPKSTLNFTRAAPLPNSGAASRPWDAPLVAGLDGIHASLLQGQARLEDLRSLAAALLDALKGRPPEDFLDLSVRETAERRLARHCWNVAKISVFLGETLGLPAAELETLALSALAYDIGMQEVPNEILSKPGALAEEEMNKVRRHPETAAALLAKVPGLDPVVARVALEHHERSDGTGYPRKLKEADTHRFSRIVAMADCFDAACAPRAHRGASSPRLTMQALVLQTYRGAFDRDLARAFLQALSLYPVGSIVRLGSGETAKVIRCVQTDVTRPVVRVLKESDGRPATPPREIDLSTAPGITISEEQAAAKAS